MIAWLIAWTAYALVPSPKVELAPIAYAEEGTVFCLRSGMRVVFAQRPESPVAVVAMVVAGGTSSETPDTRGAAHLVEHLWFRSHPGGGATIWDREPGLQIMATTRPDATVYSTVGARADLEKLLVLEAQRLLDPLQGITAADTLAERDVILDELYVRGAHGERAAQAYLDAALFPQEHPYAWSTTTVEDTQRVDIDAVRRYAAANYVPANITLSIEADVGTEELEDMLTRTLPDLAFEGTAKSCDTEPARFVAPPPPSPDVRRIAAPVWNRVLYVGWALPPGWGPDDARAQMATLVVWSSVWSRVQWAAGIGEGEAAGVACQYDPGRLASRLLCRVELPRGGDPTSTLRTMKAGLSKLWDADDRESQRTLLYTAPYLLGDAFTRMESLAPERIDVRALYAHHHGSLSDPLQELIDAYGITDLRPYFREWITPERMAAVILDPADVRGEDAGRIRGIRLVTTATNSWTPVSASWGRVSQATLANGLATWTARFPAVPVARTALVFGGGWATSPDPGADAVLEEVTRFRLPSEYGEMVEQLFRGSTSRTAPQVTSARSVAWPGTAARNSSSVTGGDTISADGALSLWAGGARCAHAATTPTTTVEYPRIVHIPTSHERTGTSIAPRVAPTLRPASRRPPLGPGRMKFAAVLTLHASYTRVPDGNACGG